MEKNCALKKTYIERTMTVCCALKLMMGCDKLFYPKGIIGDLVDRMVEYKILINKI